MKARQRLLAPLVLALLVGCSSSVVEIDETTTSPPSTSPSGSQVPTSTPTTAGSPVADTGTPLQLALRTTCAMGTGFDTALSAFIDSGVGAAGPTALAPTIDAFHRLKAVLATSTGPGVSTLKKSVETYLAATTSLVYLYEHGETAYQALKADGRDADVLLARAAQLWSAGVSDVFPAHSPSPPNDPQRECEPL